MGILTEIELVPRSQTDYYLFSVTPAFPSFLRLDPASGVISGAAFSPLPRTQFTIPGHTTVSVVNKVLWLEFVKEVNGTTTGGVVECNHGVVEVKEKWGCGGRVRCREKVVLHKELSGEHVVGIITDEVYEVSVTNYG